MTPKKLHEKEEGFTLIELLVVIIIIGILAAIAIPTFLNQREKGWDSAAKSELRNAAIAQESFFTENSEYAWVDPDGTGNTQLEAEGFNVSEDVTLLIATPTATGASAYCMTAQHDASATIWRLDSAVGNIVEGAC